MHISVNEAYNKVVRGESDNYGTVDMYQQIEHQQQESDNIPFYASSTSFKLVQVKPTTAEQQEREYSNTLPATRAARQYENVASPAPPSVEQAEQVYAVVSPSRTRGKKKREYENNEVKGDKRQCYEYTAPGLSRKEEKGESASNTLPTNIQLAGKSGYENISIPNPRMKEESNVYATPRSVQGDVHIYAVPSAKKKEDILPPNADMGEYSTIPENN